jgi:hypothetical protein
VNNKQCEQFVYSLTSNNGRHDGEPKPEQQEPKDNGEGTPITNLVNTADKSVQVSWSLDMMPDSLQRMDNGTTATVVNHQYSCVDLKGLAKLKKLCCILRRKAIELKTTYKKSHDLGYTYTESEHTDLNSGLQSLEDGTIRLLQTLDNIDGYSKEMKFVIDIYTDYESLYRKLRSVNKKARSRARTHRTESCHSGVGFDLWTMLKNYILCSTCFNV